MTSHTTEKTDRTSDARLAMYAPILARLAEPLGFEANDTNLFRYVGNAPTNGVDPTGLEKEYIVIQNHKQKSGVIVHGIEGANLAGGKPSKTGTMAKLLGKVGAEHDVWISNSTDKEPFSRRTFQKHAKAGRKMDPQWGKDNVIRLIEIGHSEGGVACREFVNRHVPKMLRLRGPDGKSVKVEVFVITIDMKWLGGGGLPVMKSKGLEVLVQWNFYCRETWGDIGPDKGILLDTKGSTYFKQYLKKTGGDAHKNADEFFLHPLGIKFINEYINKGFGPKNFQKGERKITGGLPEVIKNVADHGSTLGRGDAK